MDIRLQSVKNKVGVAVSSCGTHLNECAAVVDRANTVHPGKSYDVLLHSGALLSSAWPRISSILLCCGSLVLGRSATARLENDVEFLTLFTCQRKHNCSCEVFFGTGHPDPTLESASPSPPQGSIWHRFNIDSISISWFDPTSMPNRPLRRGRARQIWGWGPGGLCQKKPHTHKTAGFSTTSTLLDLHNPG